MKRWIFAWIKHQTRNTNLRIHFQLIVDETKNFYFDRQSSVAYRKFSESRERDPDKDLSDCIGKLRRLDGWVTKALDGFLPHFESSHVKL